MIRVMRAGKTSLDSWPGTVHGMFLWPVTTLGEAWKLGWCVRVRCLVTGSPAKSRHERIAVYCEHSAQLDMKTLVWIRVERFPLDQLANRLKCPKCGSRKVTVVFDVPNQPRAGAMTR
jgi:hypothetical protein